MTDLKNRVLAVDGATGYVGSHLVHYLCGRQAEVRAIVHPGAQEQDLQFLASCGARIFKTDLSIDSAELQKALAGCESVVHLIGSIAPKKGESLEELHSGQTKQLVEALKAESTRSGTSQKIVMITALGSRQNAESNYHKSKWQAEEVVRESGLPYTILRPSLIVGRQVGRRNSKLMARYIRLIETRQRIPVLGGGKNLLQPVFVDDLCQAITKACLENKLNGQTLEIGGEEVISMKELLGKLMNVLEKNKPLQTIPPAFAAVLAAVLEKVQSVPLVSRDQVKLSSKDNICTNNAMLNVLDLRPKPLLEALATYKNSGGKT